MSSQEVTEAVHVGIVCNGCYQCPIVGPRFKCGNCVCFNLCPKCESTHNHNHNPSHIMLKLRMALLNESYATPLPPLLLNAPPSESPSPCDASSSSLGSCPAKEREEEEVCNSPSVCDRNSRNSETNIKRPTSELLVPVAYQPLECLDKDDLKIDIDLKACAAEVLRFLSILDKRYELGEPDILRKVMVKYVKFLRLKIKHLDQFILPSDDVEAIWQSHLIRNEMYRQDCEMLFGTVVPHHIETMDCAKLKGRVIARDLWTREYGESEDDISTMTLPCDLVDKFKDLKLTIEDVIEDRQWYGFYRMYTEKITSWEPFIERSVKGYNRFISICSEDALSQELVEPTYSIDLIWHTHMFHPLEYYRYTNKLAGYMVVHEPWPKSLTQEQMTVGLDKCDERWKARFGESMHDIL